jgi:hypothetical protein
MARKTLRTTLLGIAAALVAGQLVCTHTADARGYRGYRGYARTNVNVNINRNVNVNRNVRVDVDRHGWGYHPIATGVAVGATAAVTAAVIGSVVNTLPPSCTTAITNGITYYQCGSTWYQPQYAGSNVTYVVVNPPN